jgi:heme exporter protein B
MMRDVLMREWWVASRSLGRLGQTLLFMVLVLVLFPLAISPERAVLEQVGLGAVWIMSLLAMLSAAEHSIGPDLKSGALDQMVLSEIPLWWQALAKALMHWLTVGLPIVLLSPIMCLMFAVEEHYWFWITAALFLTTPILSLLCVLGASLTAGLNAGSALMPVLVAPLMLPPLIFGTQWAYQTGEPFYGYVLAALLSLTSVVVPWIASLALRVAASR